jgi:general secretion pathway protein G
VEKVALFAHVPAIAAACVHEQSTLQFHVPESTREGRARPIAQAMPLHACPARHPTLPRRRQRAFTLIEILLIVALLGILGAVAYPSYASHVKKARVQAAVNDMRMIEAGMERYFSDHYAYPATLDEVRTGLLDPWGRPYRYLRMSDATVGDVRKDRALHPLNTDYDLYSVGPDGRTLAPLTAPVSQDDVIRASNGAYYGVASAY